MAPFGLTIGSDKAKAFEVAIQNELIRRGYTTEPDDTMSEYITIMLINNKTPDEILKECISFLGNDVERSFVDWLFEQATKGDISEPEPAPAPAPAATEPKSQLQAPRDPQPPVDGRRPPPSGPRVFQQAMGQVTTSTSPTAQKRTASARSPSPTPGVQGPNKSRRTDAPLAPRAMRDGTGPRGSGNNGPRSLLERVGPARPGPPNGGGPGPFGPPGMINGMNGLPGPFPPGMNEMEMAAQMGMNMNGMNGVNQQMMFQEMMMNHMAMMAQMASGMGMMPPNMMGGPPGMMPQGNMGGFQGGPGIGPGGPRNGPPRPPHGRGGRPLQGQRPPPGEQAPPAPSAGSSSSAPVVAAPIPQAAPAIVPPAPAFAVPARPQSPTLCKFGQKCSNTHCRWSHASPIATAESGVVLSTEACEVGTGCVDKDCIKSHVSPAAANPALAKAHRPPPAVVPAPAPTYTPPSATGAGVQCRYGMACTRRDCTFAHPPGHPLHKPAGASTTSCRFGSACTRATCPYQHPADRVLPGSFHRGLSPAPSPSGFTISTSTSGASAFGSTTHNKSVVFNKSMSGGDLEKKLKELQDEKSKAEQGIRDAQAAKKESGDKGAPVAAAA